MNGSSGRRVQHPRRRVPAALVRQREASFAFLGADGSGAAAAGPATSASYLPAPGTDDTGTEPALTNPSEARGVYQAEELRFDQAGIWRVTVDADVAGQGALSLESNFVVKDRAALPPPGDRALRPKNLTMDSKDVEPVAIDSRAQDDEPVPDPELHQWTIAEAVEQHRPALVLFATPVYCSASSAALTPRSLDARLPTIRTAPCSSTSRSKVLPRKRRSRTEGRRLALPRRRPHRALALPHRGRRHDRRSMGPVCSTRSRSPPSWIGSSMKS